MIPPRETVEEDERRLTLDLKLRSGASLHLAWSKEASDAAKSQPALNDELLKAAQALPKPPPPQASDYAPSTGGERQPEKPKQKPTMTNEDKGKKLDSLKNKIFGRKK